MTHDTQSAQITPTQDEHDIKKKKDENYFPSQLLPKQVYGNSYSWAHDVWSLIADIIEPKSAHKAKQGAW